MVKGRGREEEDKRETCDGEGEKGDKRRYMMVKGRGRKKRHVMVKERGREEEDKRETCDGEGEKGERYIMVKGRGEESDGEREGEIYDGKGKRGRSERHVTVNGRREVDV